MRAVTISSLPEELLVAILCRLPPPERHQTAPTCRLWRQLVQRSRAGELVEVQGGHAPLVSFQAWLESGGLQHVQRLQLSPRSTSTVRRASSCEDAPDNSGAVGPQLTSVLSVLGSGGQLSELELRPDFSMIFGSKTMLPSCLRRLTLAATSPHADMAIWQPLLSLTGLQYLRFGDCANVWFGPTAGLPPTLTRLVFSANLSSIEGLAHGLSDLTNLACLQLGCQCEDVELEGVAVMLPHLTRLEFSLRQPLPAWLAQLGGSLRHLRVLSYTEADAAAIDDGLLDALSQLTCLDLELNFPARLRVLPLAGGALPHLACLRFEHYGSFQKQLTPLCMSLRAGPWLGSIRELELPAELVMANLARWSSAHLHRLTATYNFPVNPPVSDDDDPFGLLIELVDPDSILTPVQISDLCTLLAWAAAHPHLAHLHLANINLGPTEPPSAPPPAAVTAAIAAARRRNPGLRITCCMAGPDIALG